MTPLQSIKELISQMQASIIGQQNVIERMVLTLLAEGNLLLEGLPGLAKTRAITSMAKSMDAGLSRIQFTPDLLPSDITGTEILHMDAGKQIFQFQEGPIFNNLILADEINRAPAKVQAALLEAMQERQVTAAGKTRKLPDLFMVMATQNPIEQEGTYPLPEAQMDRFLLHVKVSYPDIESEIQVLRLVRGEENQSEKSTKEKKDKITQEMIFKARKEISKIHLAENIETYIVHLIDCTRNPTKYSEELTKWIDYGSSPRGTIALDKVSRAHAWLNERDFVSPEDIRAIIHDVLRHRIIPSYEATADGINADTIIDELLKLVPVS
jgi:MoxR-like ATPase